MDIHCKYDTLEDVKKLKYHPANPNKHPKDQINRLSKIIEYQGWRHPVIVSRLSNHVLAGHGRLEAAKLKKWKAVPVVYQDFADFDQEYAFMTSDNAIASWADLDLSEINQQIPELGPDLDIDLLGIQDFVIEPADKYSGENDDTVPDPPKEAKTKFGDLIILGDHRLLCGDCTDKTQVERLMDGKKADMVFTDPPYSVNYTKKNKEVLGSKEFCDIKNDDMPVEQVSKEIWSPVFKNCYAVSKDDASIYVTMPQGGDQMMMMMMMMMQESWQVKHELIWVKESPVFSMGRLDYDYKHEPIAYGWKKKHNFYGKGDHTKSVWEIKRDGNKSHPTMKPVELIENALLNSTKSGQLTVDPFLGSGSTLIAAEKTGRVCYGMEIEPLYCDVIIKRWCEYTGKSKFERNGIMETLNQG